MKRTWIEKILIAIAWTGLVGGILFGTLVSKGIFESGQDMAFPQAIGTFVGSVFASIAGWAVLMEIVMIADRQRNIEQLLKEKQQ